MIRNRNNQVNQPPLQLTCRPLSFIYIYSGHSKSTQIDTIIALCYYFDASTCMPQALKECNDNVPYAVPWPLKLFAVCFICNARFVFPSLHFLCI